MNNTENSNKVDFSNIRNVQNLIKSNSIATLAAGVKQLKQRLADLGSKISEIKKVSGVETSAPKAEEKSKPVSSSPKTETTPPQNTAVAKEQAKPTVNQNNRPNQPRGDSRFGQNSSDGKFGQKNFQGQRQGGFSGSRPQGRFTPTGERRFDNPGSSDKKPGGFSTGAHGFQRQGGGMQRPNGQAGQNGFQRKPFGQTGSGFGPKLPRQTETFDASTLSRNTRPAPKKKSYDKSGEEKKNSLNKKAILMRGYAADENGIDESEQSEQVTIKRHKKVKEEQAQTRVIPKIEHAVITTDNLTVKILAETIGKSVPELMGKFLLLGMMVNINSSIDFEAAELVASEFGITLEKKVEKTFEQKLAETYSRGLQLSA